MKVASRGRVRYMSVKIAHASRTTDTTSRIITCRAEPSL